MKKKLDFALQGGGSHGAYTWGVLERMLQEEDIEIDGVCGTSAGAMNGVCVVYGLAKGGRPKAISLLHEFWKAVSDSGKFSGIKQSFHDRKLGPGNMDHSIGYKMFTMMRDNFAPKQFNPLNINPLEKILLNLIDFDELKKIAPPKLFVCATNVMTCKEKIFGPQEITVKALLASACLPHVFSAVEIDGQFYWDGGYMGNPPLYPLIENTPETNDILLVQINPISIAKVPESVDEIRDRVNEISFNSSLMLELKILDLHRQLAREGKYYEQYTKIFLHHISADKDLALLNISSKLNTEWEFLCFLRDKGIEAADNWIKKHKDQIGKQDTFNF
jgi:NTE family protein